ncbi:hypothetical protein DW714_02285 [Streptococcus anginosus]|nr:hypothetical protein DW714_02285 [Streptococcus anginosus]
MVSILFTDTNTRHSGECPMVSILFTDTNTRHWYRNQIGKLTQLNSQEYDKLVKNLGYRPPL